MMDKFKVVTQPNGESCFISVEGTPFRIELNEPADFQHAWRVANFLIENVRDVLAVNPETGTTRQPHRTPVIE